MKKKVKICIKFSNKNGYICVKYVAIMPNNIKKYKK